MGIVGNPCSNCSQDEFECVLHVSARGKHKRPRHREQEISETSTSIVPQGEDIDIRHGALNQDNTIPLDALLPTPDNTVDDHDGHMTWAEHVARPVKHAAHLEAIFVGQCRDYHVHIVQKDNPA
jgi:hypothetical protein